MQIFTYIRYITFNNCRNLVTTSYNIRSPRNHNPCSALSRLFCAWQTLFISHQRWVNLLSTSREIAWTGPWNQHSRHGSFWNILNSKIYGWSWWADSPFGFPSILWTYSTSPIKFSHPLTFNPSVAPCCLCSTRALLGLNRVKARHWVWPRWCWVGWIWVLWIGFCWSNLQRVEVMRVDTKLTVTWTKRILAISIFWWQDMVVNRTWLCHSHDFSFSTVFHCRNVLASYQCTAGWTL